VAEDFGAIEAAVLCVGGWNDAYSNAIPRLMRGLRSPCKAIIGPWVHKYPHFAVPEPRIGFLQEALRWWDAWLKGEPMGISRDPAFRTYIMEAVKPQAFISHWPGRWVADHIWMAGNTEIKTWVLNADGIGGAPGEEKELAICSAQTTGIDGGEYCIIWLGKEFPGDQRRDDQGSLTFDTPALITDMDIMGAPAIELELSSDKPIAFLAARLNDVWPSGEVSRITYGLLNLTHRDSHETPTPLEPGKRYTVRLQLDDIAMRVPKGHRLRLSLSTCYWPMMWPAPEPATLTITAGKSKLLMPIRKEIPGEVPLGWKPAETAEPVKQREIAPPSNQREVTEKDGVTTLEIVDDFGRYEIEALGLTHHGIGRETHSIKEDDPLSATMKTHWTEIRERGKWKTRTETYGELRATATHWLVKGRVEAYEGKKLVFEKDWDEKIERKLG
jgi:predicted acyl esterase